LPVTGSFQFL